MEELLEVYLIDLNSQIIHLQNIEGSITHAHDKVALQLDTMENKVLIASTLIALLTCCVTINGVVAGAFGMNLNADLIARFPFIVVLCVTMTSIVVLYQVAKRYLIYVGFIPARILLSKEQVIHT